MRCLIVLMLLLLVVPSRLSAKARVPVGEYPPGCHNYLDPVQYVEYGPVHKGDFRGFREVRYIAIPGKQAKDFPCKDGEMPAKFAKSHGFKWNRRHGWINHHSNRIAQTGDVRRLYRH